MLSANKKMSISVMLQSFYLCKKTNGGAETLDLDLEPTMSHVTTLLPPPD